MQSNRKKNKKQGAERQNVKNGKIHGHTEGQITDGKEINKRGVILSKTYRCMCGSSDRHNLMQVNMARQLSSKSITIGPNVNDG